MSSIEIKLIEIPENLGVQKELQTVYKLRALEINGKTKVFNEMKKLIIKDKNDYKKLIKNLGQQVGKKELIRNTQKVQVGKGINQEDIIEIKGSHSRLFGFIWNNEFIICTNTYWKTTSKNKKQHEAFNKAAEMRNLFLNYYGV